MTSTSPSASSSASAPQVTASTRPGWNTKLPIDDQAAPSAPPAWAVRFAAWRNAHIPDYPFMVFLAVVVGVLAGIASWFFRWIIGVVADIFISRVDDGRINWWLLFIPVAGILATGIFTRYIVRTNLLHGTGQLIANLKEKAYRLRRNITFSPMVGGTITLGMGGTSGSEGPIAVTGAAIGSNVAQVLGLSPERTKILLACGASAGIAGIFMSPIGGLMFSLELLGVQLATLPVMAVTVACLSAFGIVFICRGFIFDHTYSPAADFDYTYIWAVLGLAVFCGLYCIYYNYVCGRMDRWYKRISSPWLSNITGGLTIGAMLVLFPALYGVGYPVIGKIIHGDYTVLSHGSVLLGAVDGTWGLALCAVCILALKCWGVGATNNSGGVGGDFSPTLFAGAIAGWLYATVCNSVFGVDLPVSVFAFLGMACVMSAAIEAPLMTIFIVMDLGQSYTYAAPIGVAAIGAYWTMKGGQMLLRVNRRHRMVCHIHSLSQK